MYIGIHIHISYTVLKQTLLIIPHSTDNAILIFNIFALSVECGIISYTGC